MDDTARTLKADGAAQGSEEIMAIKNPVAKALASPVCKPRVVKAKKGSGS